MARVFRGVLVGVARMQHLPGLQQKLRAQVVVFGGGIEAVQRFGQFRGYRLAPQTSRIRDEAARVAGADDVVDAAKHGNFEIRDGVGGESGFGDGVVVALIQRLQQVRPGRQDFVVDRQGADDTAVSPAFTALQAHCTWPRRSPSELCSTGEPMRQPMPQ